MDTAASNEGQFSISAVDVEPLVSLLIHQKPGMSGELLRSTELIVDDLLRLPEAGVGPFSITLINRFRAEDPNDGHGSDWVSVEAGDEGLTFSVGNHIYSPGIGGDSSSETLFECWPGGGSTGDLRSWMLALEQMDGHLMEISAAHGNIGSHTPRREQLIAAIEKASRDPRLTPEMRSDAMRSLSNLKAISRIGETAKGEPESGLDRFEQVRLDHYAHKFAVFAMAAFGWQLHGWLVGLLLLVGLIATISLTNIAILAAAPEKRVLMFLRMNRWGWVLIVGATLVYSGSNLVSG